MSITGIHLCALWDACLKVRVKKSLTLSKDAQEESHREAGGLGLKDGSGLSVENTGKSINPEGVWLLMELGDDNIGSTGVRTIKRSGCGGPDCEGSVVYWGSLDFQLAR